MMTEKERVQATIARLEQKRDAQRDPQCRRYYQLCLLGWEAMLAKLSRDSGSEAV